MYLFNFCQNWPKRLKRKVLAGFEHTWHIRTVATENDPALKNIEPSQRGCRFGDEVQHPIQFNLFSESVCVVGQR